MCVLMCWQHPSVRQTAMYLEMTSVSFTHLRQHTSRCRTREFFCRCYCAVPMPVQCTIGINLSLSTHRSVWHAVVESPPRYLSAGVHAMRITHAVCVYCKHLRHDSRAHTLLVYWDRVTTSDISPYLPTEWHQAYQVCAPPVYQW